jgi:NitT/TauT family transport system substrate-binding protein
MDSLRIAATARGLNYLPHYYAEAAGIFASNELVVRSEVKDPWTGVLDDLETGAADVVLGGIWVPAMSYGMSRDLVAVGQLNGRFPMAIVTREGTEGADLGWLRGKMVLAPGAGGTGLYEFTAGLMRETGLDPADVRFVRDLSTEMLREFFEGGLGDAIIADLATATGLRHRGVGVVSYYLGTIGGGMPNSIYYVRRDRLEELRDVLVRFMRSIRLAMTHLTGTPATELASFVHGLWPDLDHEVLDDATAEFIENGTWAGIRIDQSACDRWTTMLFNAGLMVAPVSYEKLVDVAVVAAAER